VPLALLRLTARSADRKNSLPFGRRSRFEACLLTEPRRSILLLGLSCRLASRSLGSFRSRPLCDFARYCLASVPLLSSESAVASCNDLRSSLYSLQPPGVFRNFPGPLKLSFFRVTGST